MKFLSKSVAFLAVLSAVPAAFAVTARPSVIGNAASRMPTMSQRINASTSTSGGTSSTTTSSSLLANAECIDAYTDCIKADDACGADFQECTTRKLFHGQMPKCLSVLGQCSASGVDSLFGTTNVGALSAVKSTDATTGEVLDYTYPTDGSVLGQWILAAAINNQYDTSTCVRRVTSCLQKDSVCGADFELCTTDKDFRKQVLFCDSTIARCQAAGMTEVLGSYPWTTKSPIGGRVRNLIDEGASLAAMNAVSTCYKTIEQCFLGACAANPFRCIEGSTLDEITAANLINEQDNVASDSQNSDKRTASDVNRYLRASCLDTIGSNKYCHMTFREKTPTNRELSDPDYQEEVFDAAIDQRKKYVNSKIQDLMESFDKAAKDKCIATISQCAMRTCGEGVGSVCYTQVFNNAANDPQSIGKPKTRNEIKTGCEAIVNTDVNCQYAYSSLQNSAYTYSYMNNSVFDTLFPEYSSTGNNDPLGVVASLNASLASTYNAAAIAQMEKQCRTVAESCVKSMCGNDYVNCYRNRTDIYSSLTKTGQTAFDNSMNKVGGVLDYTVALGLCINTVKNASACEEHLKITAARYNRNSDAYKSAWGDATNVRGAWIDAGAATSLSVVDEESIWQTDENGEKLCRSSIGDTGVCNTMDALGNIYSQPVMVTFNTWRQDQAANSLFKDLIYDLEKDAQAKYNAKLTAEMNACVASNNGGILAGRDMSSTFMWAKLKNNAKIPANYSAQGLKSSQFAASNDLYGSFCRARITLQSDDPQINEVLKKGPAWATAYFAVGDAFTCGSWIDYSEMEEIANAVAAKQTQSMADQQQTTRRLLSWLGAGASAVGGWALTNQIRNGKIDNALGGLTKNNTVDPVKACMDFAQSARTRNVSNACSANGCTGGVRDEFVLDVEVAVSRAESAGVNAAVVKGVKDALNQLKKCQATCSGESGNCVTCDNAATTASSAVDSLYTQCQMVQNNGGATAANNNWQTNTKRLGANLGVSVLTGGLGYLVTNQAMMAAQNLELDAAKQAAYQEWMNSIGRHIQCYAGGEELGNYGDTIILTLE